MKKFFLGLVLALSVVSFGCATMKSVGGQVCDSVLGGSTAGEICAEIVNLGGGDLSAE